jgi:hypothetical protein
MQLVVVSPDHDIDAEDFPILLKREMQNALIIAAI